MTRHGTFERLPDGGRRLLLSPPSRLSMLLYLVIPFGMTFASFYFMAAQQIVVGAGLFVMSGFAMMVWGRLALRKDCWELRPRMATRFRTFLGMKSQFVASGVERVLAKKFTDDDQRRNLQVGLQLKTGWVQIGEDFDHDDESEALARQIAEALAVPVEIPPRG